MALPPDRLALLRGALSSDEADRVGFADMTVIGNNPARIIPAWRDFLDATAADGRAVRGIGEPVFPAASTRCARS